MQYTQRTSPVFQEQQHIPRNSSNFPRGRKTLFSKHLKFFRSKIIFQEHLKISRSIIFFSEQLKISRKSETFLPNSSFFPGKRLLKFLRTALVFQEHYSLRTAILEILPRRRLHISGSFLCYLPMVEFSL